MNNQDFIKYIKNFGFKYRYYNELGGYHIWDKGNIYICKYDCSDWTIGNYKIDEASETIKNTLDVEIFINKFKNKILKNL